MDTEIIPFEDVNLSVRAERELKNFGILTIGELLLIDWDLLIKFRKLSMKTIKEAYLATNELTKSATSAK